jgi:hypothetical protein
MKERRKNQRYKLDDQNIQGKMIFASRVKILDISMGGLSLEVDKRLNIGRQYTVHIEHEKKNVLIKGSVMWSILTESKRDEEGNMVPIYRAGMKFSHNPDDMQSIIEFIKDDHQDEQSGEIYSSIIDELKEALQETKAMRGHFEGKLGSVH